MGGGEGTPVSVGAPTCRGDSAPEDGGSCFASGSRPGAGSVLPLCLPSESFLRLDASFFHVWSTILCSHHSFLCLPTRMPVSCQRTNKAVRPREATISRGPDWCPPHTLILHPPSFTPDAGSLKSRLHNLRIQLHSNPNSSLQRMQTWSRLRGASAVETACVARLRAPAESWRPGKVCRIEDHPTRHSGSWSHRSSEPSPLPGSAAIEAPVAGPSQPLPSPTRWSCAQPVPGYWGFSCCCF